MTVGSYSELIQLCIFLTNGVGRAVGSILKPVRPLSV